MNHKLQIEILLKSAEGFYTTGVYTAENLNGNNVVEVNTLVPCAVVNMTFACELYFKGLIFLQTGKQASGHSLMGLYSRISSDYQKKIKLYYDERLDLIKKQNKLSSFQLQYETSTKKTTKSTVPKDFADFLRKHDLHFQHWRYVFETETLSGLFEVDFKELKALIESLMFTIEHYANENPNKGVTINIS